MRERKTRHRQKCKGGKRETGKRGNMTWVENARLENGAPVCRGGGGKCGTKCYEMPKMQ